MNILIRANYNNLSGAGHYMRCIRLANQIKKTYKKNIKIILDKKIDNFFYDKNLEHIFLYKKNQFINEHKDAHKVISLIKSKKDYIILDDYRLGKKWEIIVKEKIRKLIVIDDFVNRKHSSDYYINFKELNEQEQKKLKKNLPKETKKLIGNKYSIINPKIKNYKKNTKKIKKILFYAGNTGNPLIFFDLIESILRKSLNKKRSLKIYLFLGKEKKNINKFLTLKKKYNFFYIINNRFNLEKYLASADLFFGFSGNLIYENSFLRLFSFFFPSSENQVNNLQNMEDLGHYFFFKKRHLNEVTKLTNLTFKTLKIIKKLKKLCFANSQVSGKGAQKIVTEIFENNQNQKYEKKIKIPSIKIKKVNFTDINNYLFLRNKKINRDNMINKKKISVLDHYNWWLGNENKIRKNYKFKISNNKIIYIWHKIIKFKKKYLIGGWFSSGKDIPVTLKIAALKWQIKQTKKYKIRWIGVIKKNNISTLKLNTMIGFKKMVKNSEIYKHTLSIFKISAKKYHLVYY